MGNQQSSQVVQATGMETNELRRTG